MLKEKQTNTNIGVGLGIVLQLVGGYLSRGAVFPPDAMGILGYLLSLAGAVVFIWGCVNYAQGKGYSGALGLLGLLSCCGLIILVVLPDKNK